MSENILFYSSFALQIRDIRIDKRWLKPLSKRSLGTLFETNHYDKKEGGRSKRSSFLPKAILKTVKNTKENLGNDQKGSPSPTEPVIWVKLPVSAVKSIMSRNPIIVGGVKNYYKGRMINVLKKIAEKARSGEKVDYDGVIEEALMN